MNLCMSKIVEMKPDGDEIIRKASVVCPRANPVLLDLISYFNYIHKWEWLIEAQILLSPHWKLKASFTVDLS